MKLTCRKCSRKIEIPEETLQEDRPRVQCPGCGARYRLKPRKDAPPADEARTVTYPSSDARTTPGVDVRAPSSTAEHDATEQIGRPAAAPAPEAPPVFAPGDLIDDRYRVVRFIARGGMGEVYEAADLELRQEVALKTVTTRFGEEAGAVERFKREIALARRVTHPNVCRIFDLGQHQAPDDPRGPVVFLSMELLRGETLAERLRRQKRLSIDQAKPLVDQMTAALAAAHAAHVVHRDFKSENVFLVPEGDDVRAVVTDFGIARGSDASDRFAAQVTGLGIVGTPAYMAPEQVQNAPEITAAADIYALGIVIYEMVTGALPFDSPNALTTAVKRLQEDPPPPHVHAPDLPAYWERAILKCLERKPEDRFATVQEISAALEPPQRPRRPPRPADSPQPAAVEEAAPSPLGYGPVPKAPAAKKVAGDRGRTLPLVALLLVVAALSGVLWWGNRDDPDSRRVELRKAVAVWGFKNVTGLEESAWISTALSEVVATELSKGHGLRSVPSRDVAEARRQLDWNDGELPEEHLETIRRLTGSDYVVSGSFTRPPEDGAPLRLNLWLQDAALGGTIARVSRVGPVGELFSMVTEISSELLSELDSSRAEGDTGLPRDPDAARLYAEGLAALRDFRAEEARDRLEEAGRIEPENPLIHSALSSAWGALGFSKEAARSAERAFELSSGLPQEDRLVIEGRYREMRSDWAAAREVYRTLWQSFPDQIDYGLGLVSAQLEARDPQSALATIDQLRRLPAPLSEDPRIDLKEATAAATVSQIERQAAAAGRAVAKAEAAGSRLLLARALLSLSQAERLTGRPEAAAENAERALQTFEELEHTPGRAEALSTLAGAQLDQGLADQATEGFRAALEVYRDLGRRGGQASVLNNLAVIRKRAGDLDDAEDLYRQTEAIYREVGNSRGIALTVNNRAVILVDRDRLGEALEMFEGAQKTWSRWGGPAKAYALNNIAEVLRLQGRLERSLDRHREALRLRRKAGLKLDLVISLANLGALHLALGDVGAASEALDEGARLAEQTGDPTAEALVWFYTGELRREQGDFEAADAAHQKALDLRRRLDQAGLISSSHIGWARVSVELGNHEEAIDLASRARVACRLDDRRAEEIQAATVLIDALLREGRREEIPPVLEETLPQAESTEQPAVRIAFEGARTRYDAGRGPRGALAEWERLSEEARALGSVLLVLDLEVDRGAAEAAAGSPEAARSRLAAVREEAEKRGLGRIAERAMIQLEELGAP